MTEEQQPEPEEQFIGFTIEEADYYCAMAYELILTGLSMVIGWGRKQGIPQSEIIRMQEHFSEYHNRMSILKSVRKGMAEFEKRIQEGNVGYG